MIDPKILVFDIETGFNIVAAFSLFNHDPIRYDNIINERYMISAAWKELGKGKTQAVSLLNDKERFADDPTDDYYVVKALRDELATADAVIAHYGNKFDLPYLHTRMVYHGIDPLPKLKYIDTYQIAKRIFRFNSNRLDYLGKFLDVGSKMKTTEGLWLDCLQGKQKAVREMVVYNKDDVELLERVYLKLAPYAPNTLTTINRALDGDWCCPKCGSEKIQKRGPDYTRTTKQWWRVFCTSCRGWSTVPMGENKVIR